MATKETSTGPDVTFNYPGKDETVITAYRWDPVESPLAAMLIYHTFARTLTSERIVVYGHEATAKSFI